MTLEELIEKLKLLSREEIPAEVKIMRCNSYDDDFDLDDVIDVTFNGKHIVIY